MKKYIKSAKAIQPLAQYVGVEFNLEDERVQESIATWAMNTFKHTIKRNNRFKGVDIWFDDIMWSSSKISFDVLADEDFIGTFSSRLNFYDGPSEDFDDVEYLILDSIDEFIFNL